MTGAGPIVEDAIRNRVRTLLKCKAPSQALFNIDVSTESQSVTLCTCVTTSANHPWVAGLRCPLYKECCLSNASF